MFRWIKPNKKNIDQNHPSYANDWHTCCIKYGQEIGFKPDLIIYTRWVSDLRQAIGMSSYLNKSPSINVSGSC